MNNTTKKMNKYEMDFKKAEKSKRERMKQWIKELRRNKQQFIEVTVNDAVKIITLLKQTPLSGLCGKNVEVDIDILTDKLAFYYNNAFVSNDEKRLLQEIHGWTKDLWKAYVDIQHYVDEFEDGGTFDSMHKRLSKAQGMAKAA
jgi:hypothetical protein